MTILDQLADHARQRVAAYKAVLPLEEVRRQCEALPQGSFALDAALAKPGLSFICECKKASPSKGLIAPDFPIWPGFASLPQAARCGRPSACTGLRTRPRPTPLRRRRAYWTPAAAAAKSLTGPCSPQSAARTFWRAALGPKPSPPR